MTTTTKGAQFMSEEEKTRKTAVPNIERVITAIDAGNYDNEIGRLTTAISARNQLRKDAVLAQVKEVFGPGATVTTIRSNQQASFSANPSQTSRLAGVAIKPNPFIADEPVAAEPAGSPEIDDVEQRMLKEQPEGPPDIERRGASIGGLHSSDMA